MKFNPDGVIKSAYRISRATKKLQKSQDPALFAFIKKESSYLVRRSVALWFKLRFGR